MAEQLGFTKDQVTWVKVPFNTSYKPGEKNFDFDINQISITPAAGRGRRLLRRLLRGRAGRDRAQGRRRSSEATSIADLADYNLGAQTGTTSLTAIRDVIKPANEPAVFEDTNAAKQALLNGQVDAILADLPTAFYITAVEIPKSTIVGPVPAGDRRAGGVRDALREGQRLVTCVNEALAALTSDGTLDQLEQQWLSDVVDVPVLQ